MSLELERALRASGLSRAELARRLGVPHPAVLRLLRPDYHGHGLPTLRRVAAALGMRVEVRLVPEPVATPGEPHTARVGIG